MDLITEKEIDSLYRKIKSLNDEISLLEREIAAYEKDKTEAFTTSDKDKCEDVIKEREIEILKKATEVEKLKKRIKELMNNDLHVELYKAFIDFNFIDQKNEFWHFSKHHKKVNSFIISSKVKYEKVNENIWLWKSVLSNLIGDYKIIKITTKLIRMFNDLTVEFVKELNKEIVDTFNEKDIDESISVIITELSQKMSAKNQIIVIDLLNFEDVGIIDEFVSKVWLPVTKRLKNNDEILYKCFFFLINYNIPEKESSVITKDVNKSLEEDLLFTFTAIELNKKHVEDWFIWNKNNKFSSCFYKFRNCSKIIKNIEAETKGYNYIPECGRPEIFFENICRDVEGLDDCKIDNLIKKVSENEYKIY